MKSLKWEQVNAWRLSQHGLSPRLKRRDLVKAVTRTCGMQAQVLSAAELAIWARVDGLSQQHVQSALWQERTLVKTWAMRGTLHLISAGELPLYAAARSAQEGRQWVKNFVYFGMTPAQYEAILVAVPKILGAKPMTRAQLAVALAKHIGDPKLGQRLLSTSWGSLWIPSAWRGDLCIGPNRGRSVTFVNPRKWIGKWQSFEPYPALQEMVRRYLRAYGPALPEDFARWWNIGLVSVRKLFRSMEDELEEVSVEGWRGFALRKTIAPMRNLGASASVNLLPLFDAYLMGLSRQRDFLMPKAHQSRVFRIAGWISAVVLVGGRIKGVWEHKTEHAQTIVKVRMFSSPTASIRKRIEAEAERLGAFLDTKVVLQYEDH